MGDRLLEIVVLIMSHIRDSRGGLDHLDKISADLRDQGFTESEISTAYSWVIDHLDTDIQTRSEISSSGDAVRILSQRERQHFSPEAIGYLLQLKHLGLLDENEMELILERAGTVTSAPLDLEQIKIIVGAVLLREIGGFELLRQPAYFLAEDEGSVH